MKPVFLELECYFKSNLIQETNIFGTLKRMFQRHLTDFQTSRPNVEVSMYNVHYHSPQSTVCALIL